MLSQASSIPASHADKKNLDKNTVCNSSPSDYHCLGQAHLHPKSIISLLTTSGKLSVNLRPDDGICYSQIHTF